MTEGSVPSTDQMSDAALLAASATGDTEAFAVFMRRHESAVARYVSVLIGSSDVDDALQETFFATWRAAAGFRGEGGARSWLYTIARHAVQHQQRRRVDEPAKLESIEELAARAGWGCLPATEVKASDERAELLHRALEQLPREEREVLILRELDGFSGEEAADALHLSLAAMKSRLHRARIHLAAHARGLEAEERDTRRNPGVRSGVTA